ncbi:hypothetical protein V6N11_038910 [Hibiscus sabdariffa]|uniref:Terpene synthase metal-binding domain-containing protein n=1 Tax=Hibiscus sabdariffa TaxID=183260 RepID=A0ABR2SM79_9ROSI
MGGVFKDDLIINEVVAANVEEKEKRQTEKLIDNTSERNVLVGQVVGLVENSRLVVNLLEDRLVDPVQEKYSQKEPITTIGLDTELIATNGRATDIKELVNGCKEKRVEPKRSWATVVEDLVNSGQALSKIDQEVNSSETEPEIEHFDFPEDKKGKRVKKKEGKDYTKVICKAVLVVFDEIAGEAGKEGRSHSVPFAKDVLIQLVNDYQAEVKWYHDGSVPIFEEYMRVAMKASTFDVLLTISFIGMREVAGIQAFEWLQNDPKILKATNVILMNDIVSHKRLLEDAWMDVNEECIRLTAVPRDLLVRSLNLARVSYLFYKHGDGYTNLEYVKDDIRAMFVDPIPI